MPFDAPCEGHQDKTMEHELLPLLTQLNVDADKLAGECMQNDLSRASVAHEWHPAEPASWHQHPQHQEGGLLSGFTKGKRTGNNNGREVALKLFK